MSGPARSIPRRPGLTRQGVVAAAIELVDRGGLEALSVRRLGAELGGEAMSLYHHVADKDDLLDAMADALVAGIEPVPDDEPWAEALRVLARALRRRVLAHPRLAPPLGSASALSLIEAALAALIAAGLPADQAASAFWAITSYLAGALLSEAAAITDPRGAVAGPAPHATAALPVADFPTLAALAPRLAAADWAIEFDRDLDLILKGLGAGSGRGAWAPGKLRRPGFAARHHAARGPVTGRSPRALPSARSRETG